MAAFQERLQVLRSEKGLTQKAMGVELGISCRAVQSYERGERYPDFKGLLRLADYFDVYLDYLAGRSESRERR